MTYILGISAFYHDSAACLVRDGEILAAAQEERFSRKKGDEAFPAQAIKSCLQLAQIEAQDLDFIVFYDKPLVKFERILTTYADTVPQGFASFAKAIPLWLREKLWIKSTIARELEISNVPILFTQHHQAHAASAFYPSPFAKAAIITTDGVGEWTTSSIGYGEGNNINLLKEQRFPHSLGLLYSAMTYYTGFKVNSGEYKVMGLAPYGQPKYVQTILDELVDLKADGSFHLNLRYFNYLSGLTMTSHAFDKLFGGPARKSETKLTQKDMDLARSVQEVAEEIMLRQARYAKTQTKAKNLCLAGGVALNCVANGRILREKIFDDIWIQPAAGDAGGALGAALSVWYQYLGENRKVVKNQDSQKASLLGPSFSNAYIARFLDKNRIKHQFYEDRQKLTDTIAQLLAKEKVIGFFQGRMEFGPRALGARSILGDARSKTMQSVMNLKIKFRESFRPFAPVVLEEDISKYFELDRKSPYMLLVAQVNKNHCKIMSAKQEKLWGIDKLNVPRSDIPAITHIDYSARVQSVNQSENPYYYDVLKAFKKLTGYGVLVNTSFNVRGEPIVCTPQDAYRCFMRTDIDYLVLENFLLDKKDMKPLKDDTNWRQEFTLD
ncbi:carbamoyltransferase [Candidatus Beckwithbacteria bacterium]|nr:carbamoyltransferase [Candidatus Beckwithbacteria bacterium]